MAETNSKAGDAAFAIFRPGKYMESKAAQKSAAEQLENAEQMRAQGMDLVNQLNWEPDYVSDLMPTYQKAQSPVARSFLESLLTGANPSSIPSTRLGADRLRAGAQAKFDEQFGGWDALLARQREIERETPWAPGTYGHAPAVQKLPQPQAPQEPAWMSAVRADPNGQTPEGAAAIQEMWGLDPESDYWEQVEAAVGGPVPRTVSGSRR